MAVDHISFEAPAGEIFGLLGPNGAGKTTALRMLATILRPSDGTAQIGGHSSV
jgi:ABC-type multidrug transport system ATPase subunit